ATRYPGLELTAHPAKEIEIGEHQALRVVAAGDRHILDSFFRLGPRWFLFLSGILGGRRALVLCFWRLLFRCEDSTRQKNRKQKSGKRAGDSSATATKRQHE